MTPVLIDLQAITSILRLYQPEVDPNGHIPLHIYYWNCPCTGWFERVKKRFSFELRRDIRLARVRSILRN
jgi:hypothetical protein